MPEIDRLCRNIELIDVDSVERERTSKFALRVGIQLHLADLSSSNTKHYLEELGVERRRTAIHDWIQKVDLQPDIDVAPNQIAVGDIVIHVNGQRHWLYATVDLNTSQFRHSQLFQTRTTQLTLLFLRGLHEKQRLSDVTFLVETATISRTRSTDSAAGFACVATGIATVSNVSLVR